MDSSQKEEGNFLNLLQKEGVSRRWGGGWGVEFPQKKKKKKGREGVPTLEETVSTLLCTGRISNSNLLLKTETDSDFLILSSKLN